MVEVIAGFSLTNRWLLYTSLMLSPAQAISGIGSNLPINVMFLAYNWYNQYVWYFAIKKKQLHALSLLPIHFNLIYAFTYLGGVTSGNIFLAIILGLGTVGLLVLNTTAAWTSWATNLPEGFGVYKFFFFGWRTLNPEWYMFFLVWQIADSLTAFSSAIFAIVLSMASAGLSDEDDDPPSWSQYPAIISGSALALFFAWPLILWVELIMSRNHIESKTDMIAVWLFVAQVVTMLIPSCPKNFWRKTGE